MEAQPGRLTQAIVLGRDLPRLVAELQRLQSAKAGLVAALEALARLSDHPSHAPDALVALVEETLADYRGLLTRQTTEGRAILRELLVDRVVYAPAARATHRQESTRIPRMAEYAEEGPERIPLRHH